jgi:hypothetical protein
VNIVYALIGVLGIVGVTIFTVWLNQRSARRSGEDAQIAKSAGKVADDARKANEVSSAINRDSDAARRERLQQWTRK